MEQRQRLIIVHSLSATRARYYGYVLAKLNEVAKRNSWPVEQISLDDVPYGQAVRLISGQLCNGDLVVAAGGDGVAQATFQAVDRAGQDIIFATIPLGNGNDISRAFNGRRRSVAAILNQSVVDFYPLNIVVDGRLIFNLASYITFGATTVLVDYLNQTSTRRLRRALRGLTPAASVPVTKLAVISRQINELEFPDFRRDQTTMADDSIGFFVIPAAHNILRLPKDVRLASSEFFFHHGATKGKNLARKIIMAGAWTVKFPGEMTELEELDFGEHQTDIVANVSGDNINLGPVRRISAIRSTRAVKILFNNS